MATKKGIVLTGKGNLLFENKVVLFLKEVKEELDKVVWPTREQTIRYTFLVVLVAVVTGLLLGGLDYLLTSFTNFLVSNYAN